MNIVQPGSATVKVNGVVVWPAITRAARCSPGTGLTTSTGTSATPCPGCRGCANGPQAVALNANGLEMLAKGHPHQLQWRV